MWKALPIQVRSLHGGASRSFSCRSCCGLRRRFVPTLAGDSLGGVGSLVRGASPGGSLVICGARTLGSCWRRRCVGPRAADPLDPDPTAAGSSAGRCGTARVVRCGRIDRWWARLYLYFAGHGAMCTDAGDDIALLLATRSLGRSRLALSTNGYRSSLSRLGLFAEIARLLDCRRVTAANASQSSLSRIPPPSRIGTRARMYEGTGKHRRSTRSATTGHAITDRPGRLQMSCTRVCMDSCPGS